MLPAILPDNISSNMQFWWPV